MSASRLSRTSDRERSVSSATNRVKTTRHSHARGAAVDTALVGAASRVTPAEALRHLLSQRGDVTQQQLADALGVTRYSVNQLVNGRRAVTAEMALRLAKATSTTPAFWLNLQQRVDLAEAQDRLRKTIDRVVTLFSPLEESELFEDVP